jgi:hypothetical protein
MEKIVKTKTGKEECINIINLYSRICMCHLTTMMTEDELLDLYMPDEVVRDSYCCQVEP